MVAPRSFLDAGTEVLPGERKFTDYAFPPNYAPMGSVVNTGGKTGWDRSPLMRRGSWAAAPSGLVSAQCRRPCKRNETRDPHNPRN